jgi:hypothetical protein
VDRPLAPPLRSWTGTLILALSVALGVVVVTPGRAAACSCAQPPPAPAARDAAVAVFSGTVAATRSRGIEPQGVVIARFEVDGVHAGEVAEVVDVATSSHEPACGVRFGAGQRWLVYAHDRDDDETLTTNLCTRTAQLGVDAGSPDDLDELGPGEPPIAGEQVVSDWPIGSEGPGRLPLGLLASALIVLLAAATVAWRRRRLR